MLQMLGGGTWLSQSGEHGTLDPQGDEFRPYVGCRNYSKTKSFKKKKGINT